MIIYRVVSDKSTEILETDLFAFAYRLFHEDFSPIYEANKQKEKAHFRQVSNMLVMYTFSQTLMHVKSGEMYLCHSNSLKIDEIIIGQCNQEVDKHH